MSPRTPSGPDFGEADVPRDLEWASERGEQREAVANLKADVASLRKELASAREDITDIKLMLATNKGGVRALLAVSGISATIAVGFAEVIARLWHR